jgi:hypothetical protein
MRRDSNPTTDDSILDRHVRELVRAGRLPRHRPHRLWGGFGSGREQCAVCGEPLSPRDTAIEAEFRDGGTSTSHEFHVGCFAVLESEWKRLDDQPGSGPSDRGHPHGRTMNET